MPVWLIASLSLGAGVVGGTFFAFSTFVLRALADLEPPQGVLAMQRINVVVLNNWFLGVFLGTALVAAICGVWAIVSWQQGQSALVLPASLLYLLGCFGVTIAFNVPRNDRLAKLQASSAEAQAYWPEYVRQWGLWNHARTAASIAAAALAFAASDL